MDNLFIDEIKKLNNSETGIAMLAIASSEVRQTSKKTDFLSVTFIDKTGSIKGKVWDWNSTNPEIVPGTVWKIKFEYSPFKGSPQIVVRYFEMIPREQVDKGLFINSLSLEQFTYYRGVLENLIKRIKDEGLRGFVRYTLFEHFPSFLSSTGAKVNHHARLGGLLEHSCHVTLGALSLADSYIGTPKHELIDYDVLIAGGLLHDLAKIDTYTDESLILDFTVQGILISDYDMSPAYVQEAWLAQNKPISRLRLLAIQHILTSHHGKELSNKPPSTMSALLVHSADLADAHTDMILTHIPEDIMTNERIWSFGNKIVDERKLI